MSKDTLKDGREPGFYIIDNELIDNYGPTIGVYGVAVYNVLAQYANKNGSRIFPSYQTIADKLGISRPKVIDTIKKLIDVGLIKKSPRIDSAGDMTSNEYMLVKLKGGKQDLPPSKQDLPPSKREQPRVVNDVNQGGKPRLPDQDPVNKTQLNNTQSSSGDDEVARKWRSFKSNGNDGGAVTLNTVFKVARNHGCPIVTGKQIGRAHV